MKKKTTKKVNPLTVLKNEIVILKNTKQELVKEREDFRAILNQIQEILNPNTSSYNNRIPFREMPMKVIELLMFRKTYEGAIRPEHEQINNYREIIRWLIEPKTADNSRELEELRKMRGY